MGLGTAGVWAVLRAGCCSEPWPWDVQREGPGRGRVGMFSLRCPLPSPCHLQYGHETRVVLGQGKNHPGLGLRTEALSAGASFAPGAD